MSLLQTGHSHLSLLGYSIFTDFGKKLIPAFVLTRRKKADVVKTTTPEIAVLIELAITYSSTIARIASAPLPKTATFNAIQTPTLLNPRPTEYARAMAAANETAPTTCHNDGLAGSVHSYGWTIDGNHPTTVITVEGTNDTQHQDGGEETEKPTHYSGC